MRVNRAGDFGDKGFSAGALVALKLAALPPCMKHDTLFSIGNHSIVLQQPALAKHSMHYFLAGQFNRYSFTSSERYCRQMRSTT